MGYEAWRGALVAAVIGISGIGGPAMNQTEKTAEQWLLDAQKALLSRRTQDAVDFATKAIELKADFADAYRIRGRARQRLGKIDDAITDFSNAIKLKPDAESRVMRGECYSSLDRHADAITDFDAALALDPKLLIALHYRGRERFKAGNHKESIADFDRMIEQEPSHENGCWERGLSRYFAGEFAKAQKSFEDYHKVGPDDTENDLWRMLSQAEVDGLSEAQKVLRTLHAKRGGVFPQLYELYTGKIQPAEVLTRVAQATAADAERREREFYTHLYIGMWFVANRDKPKATDHLEKAVALRSADYMWYVARAQLDRLRPSSETKERREQFR